MATPIVVALISLIGSVILAVLNFLLQQRVRRQEERARQTKEQINQQGAQIADQQRAINMLVAYGMSASIFRHLCGITLLRTYNLDFHETNRRELYFLRDHGFIQPRGGGFLDFGEGTHNVAAMAVPTPVGRSYVSLRKDEIPSEMLEDRNNLLFDPSTLSNHHA
jgi:hypothetical protein